MNRTNVGGYIRISKAQARRRCNQGLPVYVCPCNLRPDNMYMPAVPVPVHTRQGRTFTEFTDEFQHYNCNYETGYYPAYYRKEGEE